jgi:hypothetical protein
MAIAAHDEPEPLIGTSLLAPAGAAVMTSGMTIASAGAAARRVMAERNIALVIASPVRMLVPWPVAAATTARKLILHYISPAPPNRHGRPV